MNITRAEAKLHTGTLPYAVFGDGEPLLYLHAAGGPVISPMLEQLAQRRRIYAPTAPGFEGKPVHEAVKGIPALADLYAEFVDTVVKAPCAAMGHSFGGWTALWMAVKRPNLISELVLEAPGGLRFGAAPTPPPSPEEAIRRMYAHPEKAKNFIKPVDVFAGNVKAFGRYSEGILLDETLAARLPEIRARTLVVLAAKDLMIPVRTGEAIRDKVPGARFVTVEDAAHAIEIDQPEQMLRLVSDFLDAR
jgi:pimeloyl-ACP methyl ester carboxylesterase